MSTPIVRQPVSTTLAIDGDFTREEADALANEFNRVPSKGAQPSGGTGTESGAQSQSPPADVLEAGNGVTMPKPLTRVWPRYTAEGRRAKIQGKVLLKCVVNADGTVGAVQVIRSLDAVYGLDEQSITAAHQWQFEPGLRSGKPVAVFVFIELAFQLPKE